MIPEPALRWQDAVQEPGIYDLEVDTSSMTPAECVDAIRAASRAVRLSAALRRFA